MPFSEYKVKKVLCKLSEKIVNLDNSTEDLKEIVDNLESESKENAHRITLHYITLGMIEQTFKYLRYMHKESFCLCFETW